MKTPAARSKPAPTKDEMLTQITALLDRPDDDIQAALMKEILTGVIRLSDSQLDVLDLKIVNRALKELRHAFRVFQGYRQRLKISVFGSARTPADDPNYQL
ncbi:MAG TPA: cytochrome D ubiquinol oxidase subunit II, partial [Nitrospira sp.]|nr:cytochrome D ubiquinol oxidase subunit II [Nitrospira sp.]